MAQEYEAVYLIVFHLFPPVGLLVYDTSTWPTMIILCVNHCKRITTRDQYWWDRVEALPRATRHARCRQTPGPSADAGDWQEMMFHKTGCETWTQKIMVSFCLSLPGTTLLIHSAQCPSNVFTSHHLVILGGLFQVETAARVGHM